VLALNRKRGRGGVGEGHEYFTWWWLDDLRFMWLYAKLSSFFGTLRLANSIGFCLYTALAMWMVEFPDTVATLYVRIGKGRFYRARNGLIRIIGVGWLLLLVISVVIALRVGEYPTEGPPGQGILR
jgi:hypothetical protein